MIHLPKTISLLRDLSRIWWGEAAAKSLLFSSKYELRSRALHAEFQARPLRVISKKPESSPNLQGWNPNSYVFMKRGAHKVLLFLLDMVMALWPLNVKTNFFTRENYVLSPRTESKNLSSKYRRAHCKIALLYKSSCSSRRRVRWDLSPTCIEHRQELWIFYRAVDHVHKIF